MFQIIKSKINQLFFMSVSQKMSGKNEEHSVDYIQREIFPRFSSINCFFFMSATIAGMYMCEITTTRQWMTKVLVLKGNLENGTPCSLNAWMQSVFHESRDLLWSRLISVSFGCTWIRQTYFSFFQNISGGKFCCFLDLLSWTAPRFRSKVAFGDMRVVGELSFVSDRLSLIQLSLQKYLFKVRQRIITISLEGSFGTKLSRRMLRRWTKRKKPASFGELWSWQSPLQFF